MTDDDVPIDPPLASSGRRLEGNRHGTKGEIGAGNTPRETRTRSQVERLGKHGLAALRDQLSERDWAVLRSIGGHRFLTTTQIQTLHFTAHQSPDAAARSCRQVLARLNGHRVIRHLERRVGGLRAGSASYVWTTDAVGRRLLDIDRGTTQRRHSEPSERFLSHALAIADTHLALITTARHQEIELLEVQLEPVCWRPFTASGGQRAVLQPDLYVTTGDGAYEDAWFIEVDLGTEHIPTLVRKCQQYETYRRTGVEQQHHGSFPWVMWLLRTDDRVQTLRRAIERAPSLDPQLFRVTTPFGLVPTITNNNPEPKGGDHA